MEKKIEELEKRIEELERKIKTHAEMLDLQCEINRINNDVMKSLNETPR